MSLKSNYRPLNTSSPRQTSALKNLIVLQSLDPRSKSPTGIKSPPKTSRTSSPVQSSRVSYQNKTPEPQSARIYGISNHVRKVSAPKTSSINKAPVQKKNNNLAFTFQKPEEQIPVKIGNKVEQTIDDSIENTVSRLMSLICSHNLQDYGVANHQGNNISINQMFSDMTFQGNGTFEQRENVYNLQTDRGHEASSDFDVSKRAKTLPTKGEQLTHSIENVYRYPKQSPIPDVDEDLDFSDIEEFKRMQAQLNERGRDPSLDRSNQETFGYADIFKGKRTSTQNANIYSQKEKNNLKRTTQNKSPNHSHRLSSQSGEEFLNAYSNIGSNYAMATKRINTDKSTEKNTPRKSPNNMVLKNNISRSKSPANLKTVVPPKVQNIEYLKNKNIISPIKKPKSRDSSLSNRVKTTENDDIPKSGRKSAAYNEFKGKGDSGTGRVFDRNANLGLMSSVDMVKHCQALIKKAKFLPPKQIKRTNELDF